MIASARWFSRFALGFIVLACADATDPAAPSDAASAEVPQFSSEGGASPSEEDFASMPSEFRSAPSIISYSTDVQFLPAERRASAVARMRYLASNASQEVNISLRFDNGVIASNSAFGENSNWLPWDRELTTTAYVGVSGSCGHFAEATTGHKAWHQFLVGGWKFLSWGNQSRSSYDSDEQPACEPPPPPPPAPPGGGGGGGDEYEGGCQLCQQWFYFIDGYMVDEWWECTSIPDYFCAGMMT